MSRHIRTLVTLLGLAVLVAVAVWVFRPPAPPAPPAPSEPDDVQFSSRYDKVLPPPPKPKRALSEMTPMKWAEGKTLEDLRAEAKAQDALDLHCGVQGVPVGTNGTLIRPGDQAAVYVEEQGVARVESSFYFSPGAGELHLEGYAPVQVSWTREDHGLQCTSSAPEANGGPYGVYAQVVTETGAPVFDAVVYGCGDLVRSEEDGSFYLTRTLTLACSLDITGVGSQLTVAVPAAEEDLDLGELTLRDVPAGLGLGLILGEMAFDEDRPQPTLVVLTILPGSPVHLAGIRPLDEIVRVNGTATAGRHPAELFDLGVGDPVSLTLEDGRKLALTAVSMEQLYEQSGTAPQDIAGKLESQSGWY